MTRILALDTSTTACSVAINCDGQIHEEFALAPRDHTKRLLPMVDSLLSRHQCTLRDLDAIAYTRGPGSFTGLRIGVGIVQGLAFGANIPVIPVSTLETMAATATRLLELEPDSLLVPILDARMNEVYWAGYRCSPADAADELHAECPIPDRVTTPAAMLAALQQQTCADKPLHILGSACDLLDAAQLAALNARCHTDCYPHAYDLSVIAERLLQAGKTQSVLQAQPAYIRNEVSWSKRRPIRSGPA